MNASPGRIPKERVTGTDQLPCWLRPLAGALADPARVAQRVSSRTQSPQRRNAAVLLLFGGPTVAGQLLFIERAQSLRAHPGEVAFPGGRYERADQDLVVTALREAEEETGLDASGVAVFGSLPTVSVPVSGYDVTAVLAWWRHPGELSAVDPGEVASIQNLGIAALADPEHRVQVHHPSGFQGPGFLIADLLIWGMTAHLVDVVLDLGGWSQPWDRTKIITDPNRYCGHG